MDQQLQIKTDINKVKKIKNKVEVEKIQDKVECMRNKSKLQKGQQGKVYFNNYVTIQESLIRKNIKERKMHEKVKICYQKLIVDG